MDKMQFSKASVEEVRVLNFIRTHGADVAEIIRLNSTIIESERELSMVRSAPRTVAESVEIVEHEAAKIVEQIDGFLIQTIFSTCRRTPPPRGRFASEGDKIVLALAVDRIREVAGQIVEPSDSLSKADREKKVVELSKAIERNRSKIVKLLAGMDEGDIMEIITRWRNVQAKVASPVDYFGSSLDLENPFHDSFYQLGIDTAKARPDFARALPNNFRDVSFFYVDFK